MLKHPWPALRALSFAAVTAAVTVLALVAPAAAEFVQRGGKLVGSGSIGLAVQQGYSVAISADGGTAVFGGIGDNPNSGAVWVFVRDGNAWVQQGEKLVGSDAVGGAFQGESVAISADGNTVLVGGSADNASAGAVWVFVRAGGVWTQQGSKLIGIGATGKPRQGWSVALSADGNTALVGGLIDNGGRGAGWVFTRSGGVWTQQGDKLVGSNAFGGNSQQGSAVALSADGNTALVGGWGDREFPFNSHAPGATWVFTRSGGTWSEQAKLVGTGYSDGSIFQGRSVALSSDGNTAVVGGYGDDSAAGGMWAFTRSGSTWSQQGGKLIGTGAVGKAKQGFAVSVSNDGNTALMGGYSDSSNVGAAWIFKRSGGVWGQQGDKLTVNGFSGPAPSAAYAIALSGDGLIAILGSPNDTPSPVHAPIGIGAAWIFGPTPVLAATTTALGSSANPSTVTQSVTFTATVAPVGASDRTPAGTVTFKDGASTLGTGDLAGGVATLSTSALAAGTHTITAQYVGDANFTASSSSNLSQTVNPAATATALASDLNPSNVGQSVTFTATVTSSAGTPTGNVTFKNGAATLGSGALTAGMATLSTAALSAGTRTIRAVYQGDGTFATSTSSDLMQSVRPLWTITVSAIPKAGGTVTGGGTFVDGSPVSVVATPKHGYAFVNWIAGGNQVSTSPTFDFTASGNRSLVAKFVAQPPTCSLKVTPALIQKGQNATLSWTSANATGGTIDQGIGTVGPKDSMPVSPTGTVSYHATFSGKGGNVDCSATLSVAEVTLLYSFKGGNTDGAFPFGAILFGQNGELFGTTRRGGSANLGTAFKLMPQSATVNAWMPSLLHSFVGVSSEGSLPSGGLVQSAAGELFGTTAFGGTDAACMANLTFKGCGTVFRLTPPVSPATKWKFAQYSFMHASPEGGYPSSDLLLDSDGGLLGMTMARDGCSKDCGAVFKLSPVNASKWKQAIQFDLSTKASSGSPPAAGGLVEGPDGTLYGVTASGGGLGSCTGGCGTIFSISPAGAADTRTKRKYTKLYSFSGGDGRAPTGTLVVGPDGSLYGVTFEGGSGAACVSTAGGCGTVFRLSPPAPGKKTWKLTTLASFAGGTADGSHPQGGLLLRDGEFYGTTAYGGSGLCADGFDSGCGTAFMLSLQGKTWQRTTLHAFTGGASDGAWPMAPLTAADAGALYGTTAGGGSGGGCGGAGCGTVFMLVR